MATQIFVLMVGFIMLMKGADWFVDGAAGIAKRFAIPPLVIGLTIVAMGTSAPEAAVSITAALKDNAGITIGNVLGSNILNTLIILGLASVITSIAVARSTVIVEIPYMLGITLLLAVLGYTGQSITFIEGVVLWAAFILYLCYLFRVSVVDREDPTEETENVSVKKLVLFIAVGILLILFGSDFAVDAATKIAQIMGMSERFIGLTIVAFGTSLPELVTSVSASRKGEADIAIGNIVGSNIFNILFVVGTTALITPVLFETKFLVDALVAAASGVLLWVCVWKKGKLTRGGGIVMLGAYAAYFAYLL
ncbi:MAG: calcium/sodium antiporter [Lachnospiraceae bacterium]|jgi:cation:H+ antiporter